MIAWPILIIAVIQWEERNGIEGENEPKEPGKVGGEDKQKRRKNKE